MASSLFTSTTAKLSVCPLQANIPQHKQTLIFTGRKRKFSRQIMKLHLHGAAFVICLSMLSVIIQDWRILKQSQSLGHSAAEIIGEALINLPRNQLKSERNNSISPEGGEKSTGGRILMGKRKTENWHTEGNEQQAVCLQAPLTYMSGLEVEPQRPSICI